MIPAIPKEVTVILSTLEGAGFEAYLVGGCVRDLLRRVLPKDWDIATNAAPEDIQRLFEDSVYENAFGTVGVKTDARNPALKIVEVTPYRLESVYSDKRHPDRVIFTKTIEEDLKRRDFTINALAMRPAVSGKKTENDIVDFFGGREDLKKKIIRAVGDPETRFTEDALRLLRAVRLAAELGFSIDPKTKSAIRKHAGLLKMVAKERIRDEFVKIVTSEHPDIALDTLREIGLLRNVAAEIEEGWNIGQNKHHIYTVWEHNIRALMYAVGKKWSLAVRLAALLHDVGKPRAKRGDGPDSTFYNHEVIGAKMTFAMLSRLKFSKVLGEQIAKLVRYHLFYYNVDEVTESSVRRLIRQIGPEDMENLIRVRICDRIGSGVPKAEPYKLRHFRFIVEKLQRDPISVGMLHINGNDIMKITNMQPGPKVGQLLHILLEEVLDDPQHNTKAYLQERTRELAQLSDAELQQLADQAKKKKLGLEEEAVTEIKKKHYVK